MVFLILAEVERRESKTDSLHILIIPGPEDGFHSGTLDMYHAQGATGYEIDSMRWRLRNILVPCCWLIPSCRQITVCSSRSEAEQMEARLARRIFPRGYSVRFPNSDYLIASVLSAAKRGVALPSIQAPDAARRYVGDWIHSKFSGRKVITITLRECSYQHDRNSNLDAWSEFARNLDLSRFAPIFVRDTEVGLDSLPERLARMPVFAEASWNVELRCSLYELSFLNMGINMGPFVLCTLNKKVNYLMFKVLTASCGATTEEYYRRLGLPNSSQLPWATPTQRYVWDEDRLEIIEREFRDMCNVIESLSKSEGNA
jgi:hypothetical protein